MVKDAEKEPLLQTHYVGALVEAEEKAQQGSGGEIVRQFESFF